MTLDELKAKLAKAEANFNACGCRIYKEEIRSLKRAILDMETAIKNQ